MRISLTYPQNEVIRQYLDSRDLVLIFPIPNGIFCTFSDGKAVEGLVILRNGEVFFASQEEFPIEIGTVPLTPAQSRVLKEHLQTQELLAVIIRPESIYCTFTGNGYAVELVTIKRDGSVPEYDYYTVTEEEAEELDPKLYP